MANEIYRDSLSAWKALRNAGGLEVDDRDEDLVTHLKDRLDPSAPDLESALAETSVDQFLQALFQSIQPFVAMFSNVLAFFERAGAREGQSQWRVSIGDEFVDFRHFEEFLEHWNSIESEFEAPALDRRHAFLFNDVRIAGGDFGYLTDGSASDKPIITGIPDADAWLAEYFKGQYAPLPRSLHPDRFPPGLADAAAVVLAAVSIIRDRGLTRDQMIDEHRARPYRSVDRVARDAFHPWIIAQLETDVWLRSQVMYIANLLLRPEDERNAFAARLADAYGKFPRRRMRAHLEVRELERLLSLPAWKQRYEFYGVWVATRIVEALDDHEVVINSANGELRFAFAEARIADIETSHPQLGLFAERRVPLADPIGEHRTASVQPDYSLWTDGAHVSECTLVVEVKHYKKRSRRNFRDALVDYARAHPKAEVVLVNYGPVGEDFTDLPPSVEDRCHLLGYLNPEDLAAETDFRKLVRQCVSEPVTKAVKGEESAAHEIIAIDVSASMASIVRSDWFWKYIEQFRTGRAAFALIDQTIRAFEPAEALRRWFDEHELGESTSLAGPVSELLATYRSVIVITDGDGFNGLRTLNGTAVLPEAGRHPDVKFARVVR